MARGDIIENIKTVLEEYYNAWNAAFKNKSGDEIRNFMSTKFLGFWSHSGIDEPGQYGYSYDIEGVLKQYGDARKSFAPESITVRNEGNNVLVFGTETNEINGTPHTAKCMFVWQAENGQWKLVREYIELTR
ncbi:hypothetical protein GCM10009001_25010 [Virgibacillus siamensis]|uniref:DUF4440 domain-containing protein n=1 Tax=Virgibacillus siamensis TaxID=480071 RepID=A0ABP3RC02_9BACI